MSCTERHIAKCHIVLSEADAKEMYWKVDGHPELLTFVWKIFCHSNILVTVIVMVAYGRFPNSIHLWNSLSYFNFQFMMSLTIWIWDIQHPLPREAESVYQHLYQFPLVFGRGHSFPLSWRPALRPRCWLTSGLQAEVSGCSQGGFLLKHSQVSTIEPVYFHWTEQ